MSAFNGEPKKYVFIDGGLRLNPAYVEKFHYTPHSEVDSHAKHDAAADKKKIRVFPRQLAIISSKEDLQMLSDTLMEATGSQEPIRLTDSTLAAVDMKNESDDHQLNQELFEHFSKHNIPIGVVTKLLALRIYRLRFIIDDNNTMSTHSDV
jgi:hypothetical protein